MEKNQKTFSQEQLRGIAWEVGARYPIPLTGDHITLLMVNPHLGYVHWQIRKESVEGLNATHGQRFNDSRMVIRVYDVTDILFDGLNAHAFFDLDVNGLSGSCYFPPGRVARNYLAEIGFRFKDGSFHYLARSNTTSFDRDRPSGNYQTTGLFVGGKLNRIFPIRNIFDAPVYERMNQELQGVKRKGSLSVAVVFLGVNHIAGFDSPLGAYIKNLSLRLKKFGCRVRLFSPRRGDVITVDNQSMERTLNVLWQKTHKVLTDNHKKTPFHVVHCHDWYSSAVGLSVAKTLNLPMILTLYSTEHERTGGGKPDDLSSAIYGWEEKGVRGANLIIVPHSSTRQQVIEKYGASPEKVVIIPDGVPQEPAENDSNPSEVRHLFGLNQDAPVVLFSGEISHAAGADLLMDALPTVCRNNSEAQFVFVGEGPLKAEMEGRASREGIAHRCRFVGDVSSNIFEALLKTSEFVVIPARTWQDQGLAQMAIGYGRPVLTTHQAGLKCVVHGENGLLTFDNPGSIVWGIQELLSNPLQGRMLHLVAKKSAGDTPSIENSAAQHYMYYENVLKDFQGVKNA
jgi:glycosyltransferase involved in cell wall biosynthesis